MIQTTRQVTAFLYQAVMSFYAPIPAIIAINLGWGAKAVGIIAAISSLGSLCANYFWPRYAAISQKVGVISLGLLGIIMGALLLHNPSTLIPAVIIMSLLPSAAYFSLLDDVRKEGGNLSKNVSKFYESDSAGRMAGLIIGAVTSYFIPINQLPFVLLVVSLFVILLVSGMMGEEGLVPIVHKGFVEMRFLDKRMELKSLIGSVKDIGFSKRIMPYLFMSGMFSMSFALVYPQLPIIVETLFGNASLFYALSILSRVFGTIAFRIAGMVGEQSLIIGWPIRLAAFLFIIMSPINKWLLIPFFIFAGIGWSFLKTYYGIRDLGSGEKLTSLNLFVRSSSYTVGSFLSGGLIDGIGIMATGLISTLVFLLAPIPLFISEKVLKQSGDRVIEGP
ncbi:MAG: MFS transporter [Candidatus Altiarchaeota archaeon]|nr:MFS transporter [Candidatus Altiarchaeota archaeon]